MQNKKTGKKLTTVTVGSSAYNEAKNITHMLDSVCSQKQDGFELKQVLIATDGCTDETAQKVRTYKDKRVVLLEGKERQGKPSRLNSIFKKATSDLLVIVDSDMMLQGNMAIATLVKAVKKKENVGLVSGAVIPLSAQTFLEKAINNYYRARLHVVEPKDLEKTAYSVHGFIAYTKKLYKLMLLPDDIVNDDAYSLFYCHKLGFSHVYAHESVARFRSPQNVRDHYRQMTRYMKGGYQMQQYFSAKELRRAIALPTGIQLAIMTHQLTKNPIGYMWLKLLNSSYKLYAKLQHKNVHSHWKEIHTTKLLV